MKKDLYILMFVLYATTAIAQKPQYLITTKRAGVLLGEIKVELFPTVAPLHAANFSNLVADKFYDTTAFHRVIPGFMIQGGDPNSRSGPKETWGMGEPDQPTVNAEFSAISHQRGILSAARSTDINSADSQFFICVASATHLNGKYSVYGRAYEGMAIADSIVLSPRDSKDNPLNKIEMFITYLGDNTDMPGIPSLTSPADNTQNITRTFQKLAWSPVTDALLYKLEVSTDPHFTSLFFTKDVNKTYHTVSDLAESDTYYWRVKANNGGYLSEWSSIFSFSTGNNVSLKESGNSLFNLEQNQPNPFNSSTIITYFLPSHEEVTLKVYDLLGHNIAILENEKKKPGKHSVTFNGSALSNGIYYYQLEAGDFIETKKMVVYKP